MEGRVLEQISETAALDDQTILDSVAVTLGKGSYPVVKRGIDIIGAAALLVLFVPIFLAVSLIIRLDSPGPVLFRQERTGRGGKPFRLIKFRTMHVHSPKYSYKVPLNDPRVTRPGRWLRRSGLDELPQLFNVLRGDMSLVGPRPELPFVVEQYEPWQHRRHLVRPGMTGWWQIQQRKEITTLYDDAADPAHISRHPLDTYYLENMSFALDTRILALTACLVFRELSSSLSSRA